MVDIIKDSEIAEYLDSNKEHKVETLYGSGGAEVSINENTFAKKLEINNKAVGFYVKYGNGVLFDPYGVDKHRINTTMFNFVRVKQNVFNSYLKYLQTGLGRHLNEARRFHSEGM